jgi:glycyl-tRNA synthetase beta chain
MRHHQRYIPVAEAQDGTLLPVFIVVRNGGQEGLDLVRAGNEKVLEARLSDARFFFEEDKKTPLAERVDELDGILFLEGFGTMRDKTERLVRLVGVVWEGLGLPPEGMATVGRAARLAKADLATKMVYEFTELEGVMGREYALLSGEPREVAEAIAEHYLPRGGGDRLPATPFGRVLAIADKLDTIVACLAAGIEPTGSHDPYGLRRQAAGVLAAVIDGGYLLSLAELVPKVAEALEPFVRAQASPAGAGPTGPWDPASLTAAVLTFFLPRLRVLLEEEGIEYDVVDAATASWGAEGDAVRTLARARALAAFKQAGEFRDLSASYIRVTGLAGRAAGRPGAQARRPLPNLFSEEAEFQLYQACLAAEERVSSALASAGERARRMAAAGRGAEAVGAMVDAYRTILEELSNLRPTVDRFFDDVLVMTEDENIRENRLALLKAVAATMGAGGDLSKLVVAG